MPHKVDLGLYADLRGAAGLGFRPDEGGRVESRGGNSILPFFVQTARGLRPRASRWARLWQPPIFGFWFLGVEVGTNLVQPLV